MNIDNDDHDARAIPSPSNLNYILVYSSLTRSSNGSIQSRESGKRTNSINFGTPKEGLNP